MAGPLPGNASCAISLTFDGGLTEHAELVAPILDQAAVRGTFFVTVPAILERPSAWRNIAQSGHEIGSHPHFGVSEYGELPWSREAVRADLLEANRGIASVTGYIPTSFAKSGVSTQCLDGNYDSELRVYSAVRAAEIGTNDLHSATPNDVRCLPWDRTSDPSQFLPAAGEWTVPVFTQFFEPPSGQAEEDLRTLLELLRQRTDVWVAPFGEVAATLSRHRDSR